MAKSARKPAAKPDAQARDRRTYLGGSDAAAVMGLSPWHTPVDLWRLKTGRAEPRAMNPGRLRQLERGKRLEPVVLEMVVDKLREQGVEVEIVARNQRYDDPEHAFLSVEIDFELRLTGTVTIGEERFYLRGELVNGDAKTVTGFARKKWGEEDTEEVPVEYAAQFMMGLMVAPGQRRLCLVAALIGLDDVAIYWIKRDDDTIAGMREQLVSFWVDHVQADVPPDPLRYSDIKDLYPRDNGRTCEATPEIAAKYAELRTINTSLSQLKERQAALQLDIGEYLGDYMRLTVNGREVITFKAHNDSRLDEAALRRAHPDLCALFERNTPVRVLRLKGR